MTSEGIDSLPPSAKLVYKVIEEEGPLDKERIEECSRLPSATVRYALDELTDSGLVAPVPENDLYRTADTEFEGSADRNGERGIEVESEG